MNLADDPHKRPPQTLDTQHPQLLGSYRTIDKISDERRMVKINIDGMDDAGNSFASTRGFEQIFGFDGQLDQCVKAREGREVEEGLRLLLAQNQGRSMRLSQTLEPMLDQESLAEIQCGRHIFKTRGLEKEFLTSAREKLPLRKDSQSRALV